MQSVTCAIRQPTQLQLGQLLGGIWPQYTGSTWCPSVHIRVMSPNVQNTAVEAKLNKNNNNKYIQVLLSQRSEGMCIHSKILRTQTTSLDVLNWHVIGFWAAVMALNVTLSSGLIR